MKLKSSWSVRRHALFYLLISLTQATIGADEPSGFVVDSLYLHSDLLGYFGDSRGVDPKEGVTGKDGITKLGPLQFGVGLDSQFPIRLPLLQGELAYKVGDNPSVLETAGEPILQQGEAGSQDDSNHETGGRDQSREDVIGKIDRRHLVGLVVLFMVSLLVGCFIGWPLGGWIAEAMFENRPLLFRQNVQSPSAAQSKVDEK